MSINVADIKHIVRFGEFYYFNSWFDKFTKLITIQLG